MYGRFNISQFVFTALFIGGFLAIFLTFQIHNGTIVINYPYKTELNICENNLYDCKQSIKPNCSPCECKDSKGYWFFYILGFVIYMLSLFYAFKKNKQLDEREEKINKTPNLKTKKRT